MRKLISKSVFKINSCSLALVVAAVAASASYDASAEENYDFALEEVVVTAQKRAQSLQDVPISVSAVNEDQMRNAGIESIQDVKMLVPTLNIYTTGMPTRTSIKIRGAGTNAADPSLEPSVGVFVDGVYMPRTVYGLSDLVDVERIEVLMGPQGTLYGKNTNAGVLSVTTKGAPTELEGSAEATMGNYNKRDARFSIGAPINDELGYRFGAVVRNRDGIMKDINSGEDYNEIDKQSYRGQLFWEPGEQLSVRAIGYYSKSQGSTAVTDNNFDSGSSNPLQLGNLGTLQLIADLIPGTGAIDTVDDNYKASVDVVDDTKLEVKGGSVQLEYYLANGVTFTSISSYQEWEMSGFESDVDSTPLDLLSTLSQTSDESFGQEFRFTSAGGETIDWLGGFYYFNSDMEIGSKDVPFATFGADMAVADPVFDAFSGGAWTSLPPAGLNFSGSAGHSFTNWSNHQSESVALFGQTTWNITDTTNITLGLRYAKEEKDFEMQSNAYDATGTSYEDIGGLLGGAQHLNALFSGVCQLKTAPDLACSPIMLEDDMSDGNITGMISVNHFIGDTMIYATVATGTKSGGFNGNFGDIPLADRSYDTEKTINYEIGVKLDGLLGGRARVNLAYFYTEYEDFQTTVFNASLAAFLTDNAGMQVTKGVNIDATVMLTENLTLTAAIEYLDARYKDYEGANCHPLADVDFMFRDDADPRNNNVCDLSGERLEFAPYWSGTVTANYVFPLDNGAGLYGNINANFKSDHWAVTDRAPYGIQRNEQVSARIGWSNDNWDVSIWARNLTNHHYKTMTVENTGAAAIWGPFLGATRLDTYSWANDPRTYGITARYYF